MTIFWPLFFAFFHFFHNLSKNHFFLSFPPISRKIHHFWVIFGPSFLTPFWPTFCDFTGAPNGKMMILGVSKMTPKMTHFGHFLTHFWPLFWPSFSDIYAAPEGKMMILGVSKMTPKMTHFGHFLTRFWPPFLTCFVHFGLFSGITFDSSDFRGVKKEWFCVKNNRELNSKLWSIWVDFDPFFDHPISDFYLHLGPKMSKKCQKKGVKKGSKRGRFGAPGGPKWPPKWTLFFQVDFSICGWHYSTFVKNRVFQVARKVPFWKVNI